MILLEELDNSVSGVNDLNCMGGMWLSEVTLQLVSLFHCREKQAKLQKNVEMVLQLIHLINNFTWFMGLHILILIILFNVR